MMGVYYAALYTERKNPIMNKRKFVLLTFIVIVFVILSACSGGEDPLDGTAWQLGSFGKSNLLPGAQITAEFADGQVSGSSGCNSYFGSYEVKGDKITFGAMGSTLMACQEDVMAQEQEFLSYVGEAKSFVIRDNRLVISRPDGGTLIFTKK
jgi:heat shock protein HslJ